MSVEQLGEFGVINDVITRGLRMPPAVSVGPGDDSAVFLVNGSAVTSVDMLVENVHFRRDWSSAEDIGRKSVAVNVADIEAMGASPLVMVIALGMPAATPTAWVSQFMAGVREEAELAGVSLVGGDLTGANVITISVTVIGETAGCGPVLRSGAKVGDAVAYRGRLGWAAAGLAALLRGFRSPRAAVDSQRHPAVVYGAGRQAAQAGAHAMIDVSDGLLGDLGHICECSGVVIELNSSAFVPDEPVSTVAQALNTDPLSYVLTGGEDHAMAATFAPENVPEGWTVVGTVARSSDEPAVLLDGKPYEGGQSWTHFRS